MTHLLGSSARSRLHEFASCRSVVVFDFDGVLAPIVARRDMAHMRLRTQALLAELCSVCPCAVVSGRSLADTVERLDGAPVQMVYGSHGLEPGPNLQRYRRMIAQVRDEITARLAGCSELDIEDKRYSLAVHYRAASNRTEAHRTIVAAAIQLAAPIRLVEGKCVVNIVPKDAPHKGDATLAIQRNFAAEQILYIGDDVTDEDAFRYAAKRPWLSVRVGKSSQTAAIYYLRRQSEIDLLLCRLIRLRRARALARSVAACAQ